MNRAYDKCRFKPAGKMNYPDIIDVESWPKCKQRHLWEKYEKEGSGQVRKKKSISSTEARPKLGQSW